MKKKYLVNFAICVCLFSMCLNDGLLADTDSNHAITQEEAASCFNALTSTAEGFVLFWGWDEAEENGYEPSVLTGKEKESFIAKGLSTLSKKVEDGDRYSEIYANALVRYYLFFKEDRKKSLYWAFKGAENGCPGCMCFLSGAYMSGNGIVQDFEEGTKWRYLSAALGNEFCKKWVTENGTKGLLYKETALIFREGKARANQWMKEHPGLFISAE